MGHWAASRDALCFLAPVVIFGALLSFFGACLYHGISLIGWRGRFGFLFMFALFGVMIGTFVGTSKIPIVSAILPPTISLIAAYVAHVSSKDYPEDLKSLVPGAVILLLLSLLFSTYYTKYYLNPSSDPGAAAVAEG